MTNPPYIRLAELEVDAAHLESFEAAIREVVDASVRTEPGVLALYAMAEKDRPTRVRVFEIYTDEAAYAAHRQTPHFRAFFEATQVMGVSRTLIDAVPIVLRAKAG